MSLNTIEEYDINLINESHNYSRLDFGKLAEESIKENTLSILNHNIRSLPCNGADLTTLLKEQIEHFNFSFDIITLQETWLDSNLEQFTEINGYNLICKHKPKVKAGGGICMFIKEGIDYKLRPDLSFSINPDFYYDCLFIEIQGIGNNKNSILGTIYRPPNQATVTLVTNEIDKILKSVELENKNCIITGDLN